jgi:NAD(P)-dependent dehydrogenase (short-subunit alcohol dehydrogenase family)
MMTGRLEGKTTLVTGAGSGIGRSVAERFAREGASVIFSDRDIAAAREAAAPFPSAIAVRLDIADESSVEAAFAVMDAAGKRPDVVVANAGVQLFGQDAKIADLDLDVWQRTVDINLTGTFLTTKHAVRSMLGRGGSIILTGSPTGLNGEGADFTAYSSTKAGIHGLGRTVAAAYADQGIRVNTVVPGTPRRPSSPRSPATRSRARRSSDASRWAAQVRHPTSRASWSTWPATSRASPPAPRSASTAA